MYIPIIFEDEYLLVIDKPAGIVVNNSENVEGLTVQDWAEKKLAIKQSSNQAIRNVAYYQRGGIVHRLDKETSGLLLIAKSPEMFLSLQNLFKRRQVVKVYLALVHGKLEGEEITIYAPVGRLSGNRRKFGVLLHGREAKTTVYFREFYQDNSGNQFTLIAASPQTGRTHQIRIHLKHIGHPIVSDSLYVGRKIYRSDIKFCPRLFLHAHKLKFRHPVKGNIIELMVPLPTDLRKVMTKITHIGDLTTSSDLLR